MSVLESSFRVSELARILDTNPANPQNWTKAGLVTAMGPNSIAGFRGGGERGRDRRYSFHALMEIAVAVGLVEVRVPPKRAFEAAKRFAYFQSGDPEAPVGRLPGVPFHHQYGETWIYLHDDRQAILCLDDSKPVNDQTRKIRSALLSPSEYDLRNYVAVNITSIFNGVCERAFDDARKDGRVVLDEIYENNRPSMGAQWVDG